MRGVLTVVLEAAAGGGGGGGVSATRTWSGDTGGGGGMLFGMGGRAAAERGAGAMLLGCPSTPLAADAEGMTTGHGVSETDGGGEGEGEGMCLNELSASSLPPAAAPAAASRLGRSTSM